MTGTRSHRLPSSIFAALFAAVALANPAVAQRCPDTPGQQALVEMNRARKAAGLPQLVVDIRLVRAAQAHAADQATRNRISHRGSDRSEPADRATAAGYMWTFVAENVAAGYVTGKEVVTGWLESPSHRDNIMDALATHVGIGYVRRDSGTFQHYWSASFGASRLPVESPTGGCHP